MKKIVILDGHPDPDRDHYVHALADAYAEGAEKAGHEVRMTRVADLDFPVVRVPKVYFAEDPPTDIAEAQETILWANHLVILYPLWQGMMPALLKAFFEQVARPGFALSYEEGERPRPLLGGRSARIIVTMGMPAFMYRWVFRAHSLKALERSFLGYAGIDPVRHSLIGAVDGDRRRLTRWIERVRVMGAAAK